MQVARAGRQGAGSQATRASGIKASYWLGEMQTSFFFHRSLFMRSIIRFDSYLILETGCVLNLARNNVSFILTYQIKKHERKSTLRITASLL